CANTFRAAELEGERNGATLCFIHKSSWRNRLDETRQAVRGARAKIRRYRELAADLLATAVCEPLCGATPSSGQNSTASRSSRQWWKAIAKVTVGTTRPTKARSSKRGASQAA